MVHLLWPTRSYFYFNLDRLQTRVDLDDLGYSGLSLSLLTIHFTLLRLVNLHLHYRTLHLHVAVLLKGLKVQI